jgi:hypothetical protein
VILEVNEQMVREGVAQDRRNRYIAWFPNLVPTALENVAASGERARRVAEPATTSKDPAALRRAAELHLAASEH